MPANLKFPSLVLDASNPTLFCGVLCSRNQWLTTKEIEGVALENLFPIIEEALSDSGTELTDLKSFVYCEGPGSVLGLRLAAMALQTWHQLSESAPSFYAYNGLQLTARLLTIDAPNTDALLISDWKKNAWNAVRIENGCIAQNEVIDDSTLENWDGPIFHLPQRKGWQTPPARAKTLAYQPGRMTECTDFETSLRKTDTVELSQTAANTFAKWTPQRHRAPTT